MTKGEVNIAQGCQHFAYEQGKEDETYAFIIASRFKTMDLKDMIMGGLMNFAEQKQALRKSDEILDLIKAKCRIN